VSTEHFNLAARSRAQPAARKQDYCVFTRSGRDFAVSVSAAHEVVAGKAVTQVPQAPVTLIGVVNLRGEVLPLLQLDSLLDMPSQPYSAGSQIVVVSSDDLEVGLLVDRVRDVRAIDAREITPCPEGEPGHRLCLGAWHSPTDIVAVLDAEKLIAEAVNTIRVPFQRRPSCRGADNPGPPDAVPLGNK
jgi:purine-binding chemotaxis protein CheW